MTMEINGNHLDYAVGKQNYSSYAAQSMAGSSVTSSSAIYSSAASSSATSGTKKKETEKTQEITGSSKLKSTAEYANELAKLAPSVEFKVGNSFSPAKSGKTLTINPQLLKKMQNDPEKEKEMKELIKGVESATNLMDSIHKASGWTVVYRHSYIDENGKYRAIACVRNDFMLNMSDELREERKKNSEKLFEKTKEKATEKKEKLEVALKEKKAEEETEEKTEDRSAYNKAEQLLEEKMAVSKDGTIYLNDTDMKTIIEAVQEEEASKNSVKEPAQVGANLDLKV